ncbi:MAG TPA: hypothetical protein VGF13_12885 [Verrucomicrobiae bacterium]
MFAVTGCALWLAAFSAAACSCLPNPPPKEALAKAAAVFSGTVENTEKSSYRVTYDGKEFTHERIKVTVRVQESWKGTNAATLVIYTETDGAMCGYSFAKGTRYIIYAHQDAKKDLLVSLCSRTAALSQAHEDVQALGAGKKP